MSSHPSFSLFLAASMATAGLVSCGRQEDPGITEKIALLEAELRNRDEQISALQEEASSASSDSSSESTSGAPDLDAAKGSYLAFVEDLRKKLAEAMPTAKFDRTSVFPVEGPDPAKPIVSRVAFRILAADGASGEMVVPLAAAPSGEWQDPGMEVIIAAFKTKKPAPAAPPAQAGNAPAQPAAQTEQPRTRPSDVMGANKTFDVDWGDGAKPGQQPQRNTAPAGQQAPPTQAPPPAQPPATPKKVLPTDRDVIIDFE